MAITIAVGMRRRRRGFECRGRTGGGVVCWRWVGCLGFDLGGGKAGVVRTMDVGFIVVEHGLMGALRSARLAGYRHCSL
jgi:hypothetical protein